MFTIKHVTTYGNETVISAKEVSFTPNAAPIPLENGPEGTTWASIGTVWWQSSITGELVPIRDGDVYVMNEHGATVSRWKLAVPDVPAIAA